MAKRRAERRSVAPDVVQADLFCDRDRCSMSWSKVPDPAKPRVLERLAQLLRASNDGPDNGEGEDGDE